MSYEEDETGREIIEEEIRQEILDEEARREARPVDVVEYERQTQLFYEACEKDD